MTVIVAYSTRTDGLRQTRIAPTPAALLVAVRDVVEELPEFMRSTAGRFILPQKPEKFLHKGTAKVEGSLCVLVNIACQQPAFGEPLQFSQAESGIRFCETKV